MARIFGITGIGMGKSALGALLAQRGVVIIDTDVVARQVVEPGQPALAEIAARFGPSVLKSDETLDRQALARRVFPDHKARADLEAILHPRIHAIWSGEVLRWRREGVRFGAVVIPLLFETKSEGLLDAVICAACSTGSQMERLRGRGWTDEQIQQRLHAQWPIEKKIALSNYVAWTDTPTDVVENQLDNILRRQAA